MSIFEAYSEVESFRESMYETYMDELKQMYLDGETLNKAKAYQEDYIHEHCDTSWTIYNSKANAVFAEWSTHREANDLFEDLGMGHYDSLQAAICGWAYCLADAMCREALEQAYNDVQELIDDNLLLRDGEEMCESGCCIATHHDEDGVPLCDDCFNDLAEADQDDTSTSLTGNEE